MIVNLFNRVKFPLIFKMKQILTVYTVDLQSYFRFQKLYQDANHLKQFFKYDYPRLKLDLAGNSSCVSCDMCQQICPTQAIELKKTNMVNFPKSLTSGEAPLNFFLDVTACTKCGQCLDVCAVDALELKAHYYELETQNQEARVDLMSLNRA